MRVNRRSIIKALLANNFEQDFFQFVDFIHDHNTPLEFPQQLYDKFYATKVRPHPDVALRTILSQKALLESDIFTHEDKNASMIGLSKAVYDFLIFLDISRGREFSKQEFESFRQEMAKVVKDLMRYPQDSVDYQEAKIYFHKIIGNTLSELKSNIEVIGLKVDDISDLYQKKERGQADISVNQLYERAETLYHRHILPCLEFISPTLQLKQAETFLQSLARLQAFYESIGQLDDSIHVQYRITAVSSYYKDVKAVADRLQQYLEGLAEDRKYFLLIERAYSDLLQSLEPLQHGRMQNRFLTRDSKIAEYLSCLDGIAEFKKRYSARFNRDDSEQSALIDFKNYFENIQQRRLRSPTQRLEPLPTNLSLDYERQTQILAIIGKLDIPHQIDDIYQWVYQHIAEEVADYTLIDLLYGIEFVLPLMDSNFIRQTGNHQRVEDNQYFYHYNVLSYAALDDWEQDEDEH